MDGKELDREVNLQFGKLICCLVLKRKKQLEINCNDDLVVDIG